MLTDGTSVPSCSEPSRRPLLLTLCSEHARLPFRARSEGKVSTVGREGERGFLLCRVRILLSRCETDAKDFSGRDGCLVWPGRVTGSGRTKKKTVRT